MTETARTHLRSMLLVLCLLPAAPVFSQPAPNPTTPSERLQNAEWSLVRPAPVISLHTRKVIGFAMLVPAGTLFMLYLFRPRPYVLAAACACAAGSMMRLVLSYDSGATGSADPDTITVGRVGIGLWSFAALIFGAALRLASGWFRSPALIPRTMFWATIVGTAWVVFGAALLPRPAGILVPAFLLMTIWHVISAYGYLQVARQHRFVGAAMAGMAVFALALVNVGWAAAAIAYRGIGPAPTDVASLNVVATGVLILGMHLLIFEDLIEELRGAATELAKSRDEMKAMAVTDPLTGCYNRRLLYEIAEHELEHHRRYQLPLSILYLDIDHFKAINDTRGHQTGDEVLQTMGEILRELTRQADYVFRWGGDEFVVLLSAAEADARIKARQIRRAFLESAIVSDLPDGVDVSIGCVAVPTDTGDFDPLIDQADREMYRRKRTLAY